MGHRLRDMNDRVEFDTVQDEWACWSIEEGTTSSTKRTHSMPSCIPAPRSMPDRAIVGTISYGRRYRTVSAGQAAGWGAREQKGARSKLFVHSQPCAFDRCISVI